MLVRAETPADVDAIHAVNVAAFETQTEANLVAALRTLASPVVSLVAEKHGLAIGHIMFSPMTSDSASPRLIMGLAPMAVLPAHQRRGVGSQLVRDGIDACRRLEAVALAVLGHPEFYPRFGFVPASRFGLKSEYDVPDEAFMALELEKGSLADVGRVLRYHPAFATV